MTKKYIWNKGRSQKGIHFICWSTTTTLDQAKRAKGGV